MMEVMKEILHHHPRMVEAHPEINYRFQLVQDFFHPPYDMIILR
jgi:hypothetical protein